MGKSEPAMPVMALGALAVFAIAATILYVGVSARGGAPPAQVQPSISADTDVALQPDATEPPRG